MNHDHQISALSILSLGIRMFVRHNLMQGRHRWRSSLLWKYSELTHYLADTQILCRLRLPQKKAVAREAALCTFSYITMSTFKMFRSSLSFALHLHQYYMPSRPPCSVLFVACISQRRFNEDRHVGGSHTGLFHGPRALRFESKPQKFPVPTGRQCFGLLLPHSRVSARDTSLQQSKPSVCTPVTLDELSTSTQKNKTQTWI